MNNQLKKFVSLSIITSFVFVSPFGVVAKAEKPEKKERPKVTVTRHITKDLAKEIKKAKKARKKELKRKLRKEDIKKQLEEIIKREKLEDVQGLLVDMKRAEIDLKEIKEEIKKIKLEIKRLIKKRYSEEELIQLKRRAEEIIVQNPKIKVIPVENIIKRRGYFKFDTPPVIKQGRTLIPVRAITEGLGANVTWNGEERKVIVSKGDVEIVFQLEDGKVFVNGEETAIDVPAQIMNNRTIVPLRFIAENLGLKVDYDSDTGMIEIDEETDQEESIEEDIITIEDIDEEDTVVENVYKNE
ncbi:copper amine oxidase N-terminal domain-containing protein [Crassaminicella thermophila]|nr:copper amine oxidase N-terminal domain-containing protein [Crassaminicella thermophila]